MLIRFLIDPEHPETPIPNNVYEFGITPINPGNSATISTWQNSNVFEIFNGRYYVAARLKADPTVLVRDEIISFYSVDPDKAIILQGLLNESDAIREITVQTDGQSSFAVGADEDRRKLFLGGGLLRLNYDYKFVGPNLLWISPDFSLKAGRILQLTY